MRKTQSIQMVAPRISSVASTGVRLSAPNGVAATRELGYLEAVGRRFPIGGAIVSIGRDRNLEVALDDPGVSLLHAQITRHEDALYLRDLGSRNGTWVNRARVTVPHQLRSGDRIHVGQTELVFQGTAAPSPPLSFACKSCGKPLGPEARFCTSCGFPAPGGSS